MLAHLSTVRFIPEEPAVLGADQMDRGISKGDMIRAARRIRSQIFLKRIYRFSQPLNRSSWTRLVDALS